MEDDDRGRGAGALGHAVRVNDELELLGGVEKRSIVIVDYTGEWPRRFELERQGIAAALGPLALRTDHVGSTAVPGLAAKPVVDIQVSVRDPEAEPAYLPQLQQAGYQLRVRSPGHWMVRTAERDVHVHICGAGSDWERRHLLFRDWLRRAPADRALYQATKEQLALTEWSDMNAYADAKTAVIREISSRAEAWAASTGWSP